MKTHNENQVQVLEDFKEIKHQAEVLYFKIQVNYADKFRQYPKREEMLREAHNRLLNSIHQLKSLCE